MTDIVLWISTIMAVWLGMVHAVVVFRCIVHDRDFVFTIENLFFAVSSTYIIMYFTVGIS